MTITIRRASSNDAAAYAHLMSDPAFAMARLHPNPPQIGAAAATA
jgi:hypothetical protein